jgi:hypothetical protein
LLKNVHLTSQHSAHQTALSIVSNYAVNVNICRRMNYFQILGRPNVTLCHTSTRVKVLRETKRNAIFARLYVFGQKKEIPFKIIYTLTVYNVFNRTLVINHVKYFYS